MDAETREYLEGIRADLAAVRQDVAVEGMRDQMKIMAEGIVMNAEALSELRRGR